jgi:hypothetical protein
VTPTLDYRPRLVEANRDHRITAPAPGLEQRSRYWTPGTKVLDQGTEGACVGFGVVGEAMASPARRPGSDPLAFDVYSAAKRIDEWEGVDYEGTSVRAGMLVGRERGWWAGFRWAFTMTELRAALEEGPVVIGCEWREGMYQTTDEGFVLTHGRVVGGHCLLLTGYSPNYRGSGARYRWRNSWGRGYGVNGNGYIRPEFLEQILFAAGGEAAVPTGRTP